jgi:anti-sigma factor RsiW
VACNEKKHLLHGYFDGELDLLSTLEMEEHLKKCPECAQDLRSQQTLRGALQSANLYQPAPQRLEDKIRASLPGLQPGARPSIKSRPWQDWLAIAAAIAIVAFVGIGIFSLRQRGRTENLLADEVVESHVRSLQLGHLEDVQSTDQHTVKPWFDGKIDFAPPVTDFTAQGFPLVGGRLDYLDHHNVAALVYQRRKHIINVFIWPDETRTTEEPSTETIDGYNIIHWRQNAMNFWMISDVSADDEKQLTALLRP